MLKPEGLNPPYTLKSKAQTVNPTAKPGPDAIAAPSTAGREDPAQKWKTHCNHGTWLCSTRVLVLVDLSLRFTQNNEDYISYIRLVEGQRVRCLLKVTPEDSNSPFSPNLL